MGKIANSGGTSNKKNGQNNGETSDKIGQTDGRDTPLQNTLKI